MKTFKLTVVVTLLLIMTMLGMSCSHYKPVALSEIDYLTDEPVPRINWVVSYDFNTLSEYLLPTDVIEEQYYLDHIPAEYADAFIYYTRNRKGMRPYFYSLMVHESNNFTAFKHRNADGSYDYGPSQLNSKNIASKKFRDWYNPTDESHITSKYCFYMVMTINFYWDLVNKYGYDYAFFAYNGGEKTIKMIKNESSRNASLINNVKAYDSAIRKIMADVDVERDEYIRLKRYEHCVALEKDIITKKHIGDSILNQRNSLDKIYQLIDHDTTCYIRREDLLQFEIKEGVVVGQAVVGTLNIQC